MGMPGPFRSSCAVYDKDNKVDAPNPNPIKFKLIEVVQIGRNIVAEIEYQDCKNFEGIKICVYRNLKKEDFLKIKVIDPHFSDGNLSVSPFARFEPTHEGKIHALLLARRLV